MAVLEQKMKGDELIMTYNVLFNEMMIDRMKFVFKRIFVNE